jgi:hypothetical protein
MTAPQLAPGAVGGLQYLDAGLAALGAARAKCTGNPAAIEKAATQWDGIHGDLATGVVPHMEAATIRATSGEWSGNLLAGIRDTSALEVAWIGDGATRAGHTGDTLRLAARVLHEAQQQVQALTAAFVAEGTAIIKRTMLNTAVANRDLQGAIRGALSKLIGATIVAAAGIEERTSSALHQIGSALTLQGTLTATRGASPFAALPLFTEIDGSPLNGGDYPGRVAGLWFPQNGERRTLAFGYGLLAIAADQKRMGLGYALTTWPSSTARYLVTDTSTPFADPDHQWFLNSSGHAAWAATNSLAVDRTAEWLNPRVTPWLERKGAVDWMRNTKLLGSPLLKPGETFRIHSGVGPYFAVMSGATSFAYESKGPLFTATGLGSVDDRGVLHPRGAGGEVASLGYDIAATTIPPTTLFGLERWKATGDLAQVKKTMCGEVFVGAAATFAGRVGNERYNGPTRLAYAAGAGAAMSATRLCDDFDPPGAGGSNAASVASNVPVSQPAVAVDANRWLDWHQDPELNPWHRNSAATQNAVWWNQRADDAASYGVAIPVGFALATGIGEAAGGLGTAATWAWRARGASAAFAF